MESVPGDAQFAPRADGVQVEFLDQTGSKKIRARISPSVTVKRILPNIISKMSLPATAPDGTPMAYSLDHKEGGRRLNEDQTLPAAGVKEGDHLIVFPEIVAGAVPAVQPTVPAVKRNSPSPYTAANLAAAKRRFLAKCEGPRAVVPIEPSTVACIIDQFLQELGPR